MVHFPINEDVESNCRNSGTSYPVSADLFWHNGIHITGTSPLQTVYDGKIVAVKLTKEYDNAPIPEKQVIDSLRKMAGEFWSELEGSLKDYFTEEKKDGVVLYKRNSNLSDDKAKKLSKLLHAQFSSNFALFRHEAISIYGTKIVFYSLYHHLKPQAEMSVLQKSSLFWYDIIGKVVVISGEGIPVYDTNKKQDKTIIKYLQPNTTFAFKDGNTVLNDSLTDCYCAIEVTGNGRTGIGYINLKDTKSKENEGKRREFLDANDLSQKVTICGIEIEVRLKDGLKIDSCSNGNAAEIPGGMSIGFPGSFCDQKPICHVEVFCPENAFMTKEEDKRFPCGYRFKTGNTLYKNGPKTDCESTPLPDGKQAIPARALIKVSAKKSTIDGVVYREAEYYADIVHEGAWIKVADINGEDGKYIIKDDYGMFSKETKDTTVLLIDNIDKPDETSEITLYKKMRYWFEKDLTKTITDSEGVAVSYHKVRYVYQLRTDSVEGRKGYIPENVFQKSVYQTGVDNVYSVVNDIVAANWVEFSGIGYIAPSEKVDLPDGKTLQYLKSVDLHPLAGSPVTWNELLDEDTKTTYWANSQQSGMEEVRYSKWNTQFKNLGDKSSNFKETGFDGIVKDNANLRSYLNAMIVRDTAHFGSLINGNKDAYTYLAQVTYQQKSEWKANDKVDKALHSDDKSKKERITAIRKKICFWDEAKGVGGKDYPSSEKNWFYHPINFLEQLRKVAAGHVETLKKVQDIVMAMPCLAQGAKGLYKAEKPKQNQTYCNHAVYVTIKATDGEFTKMTGGVDCPPWINDDSYPVKSSNYWCDVLAEAASKPGSGIIELDGKQAQDMANIGYTVIGAWKNLNHKYYEDLNTSPHFVTVRPGENYKEGDGPMVAHVGGKPNGPKRAIAAFSEKKLPEIKWYYNSRQDFRAYMGDVERYSWRTE